MVHISPLSIALCCGLYHLLPSNRTFKPIVFSRRLSLVIPSNFPPHDRPFMTFLSLYLVPAHWEISLTIDVFGHGRFVTSSLFYLLFYILHSSFECISWPCKRSFSSIASDLLGSWLSPPIYHARPVLARCLVSRLLRAPFSLADPISICYLNSWLLQPNQAGCILHLPSFWSPFHFSSSLLPEVSLIHERLYLLTRRKLQAIRTILISICNEGEKVHTTFIVRSKSFLLKRLQTWTNKWKFYLGLSCFLFSFYWL